METEFPRRRRWPDGRRAAIAFTFDNMGEAADLNRRLWPESEPIGKHFSVTQALPAMLDLLGRYDVIATFFIESWNTNVYGDFILDQIAAAGHEIAWHGWQHEAWAKLDEDQERANFERSFGPEGIKKWLYNGKCEPYKGFRPPGGIINGDRTLHLCKEFGIQYISPAGENAAAQIIGPGAEFITVLPFKWATVDAYFYMETFAGLRKMKGEYPAEPQSTEVLKKRYFEEIDKAISAGGYLSVLFHPFLTTSPERLEALESVLRYVSERRDARDVWIATCKEVDKRIREYPCIVGDDPQLDLSSWR